MANPCETSIMPYLETPDELADHLADLLGIYGAHGDQCTEQKPCRVCWVPGMTERIRSSVLNEQRLVGHPADGPWGPG